MDNISQNKLQNISDTTTELISIINDGVKWSDQYLNETDNIQSKKLSTSNTLKHYRRNLNKIRTSIVQRPVIALFGASQVGKSYLVKNLLSLKGKPLTIINPFNPSNDNERFDFLEDINPEGGNKESTSVVTRFTISNNSLNADYPVRIKLLSPKDIIIVLCDSYFSDFFIRNYEPKLQDIDVHKENIEEIIKVSKKNNFATQYFLAEDDIYDIKEYLENHFQNLTHYISVFQAGDYWNYVAANIHYIPFNEWVNVFNVLWGKSKEIDNIFKIFIDELVVLKFQSVVYTTFDAVLRKYGTILDVQRLSELNSATNLTLVKIQDSNGNQYNVQRSVVCALTSEVTLNIDLESLNLPDDNGIQVQNNSQEPKIFVKNSDILDFPGARSRLVLNDQHKLSNVDISQMILRGKVSYLFNKYSENYEINNLFLCLNNKQNDVTYIPGLIHKWINFYIGADPKERYDTLKSNSLPQVPLFVIFTWFNCQLEFDQTNDKTGNFNYKWFTRFDHFFAKEFIINEKLNWHNEWLCDKNNNYSKFKNVYLLRDFKYSKDTYDGFEKNGIETGFKDDREVFIGNLKDSFIKYPFIKEHFQNPIESWDETTQLNKNGSDLIIRNLNPVSTNNIRTKRFNDLLEKFKNEALAAISGHYHSSDSDKQIIKADQESNSIENQMSMVFFGKKKENIYLFSKFIESFTISESSIYILFHEWLPSEALTHETGLDNYAVLWTKYKELDSYNDNDKNVAYQKKIEFLREHHKFLTIKETEEYFEKDKIDLNHLFFGKSKVIQNKSEILATKARDKWFETKLNIENFRYFINLGFDENYVKSIIDNLKVNFNQLDIVNIIANKIQNNVNGIKTFDVAEEMSAHITAGIINNFVNTVGWTYLSPERRRDIAKAAEVYKLDLEIPDDNDVFKSVDKEDLAGVFEVMSKLDVLVDKDISLLRKLPMVDNFFKWSNLLKISFIANCKIPTYDPIANEKLGLILDKMKLFNFSID